MAFSFFFRDLPTLEAAVNNMYDATIGQSRVRVWDAGCAMGYELFTLSMLLSEKFGHFGYRKITIYASDIEKEFGDIIKKAEYPGGDIERIPDYYRNKYFSPAEAEGIFRVSEHLCSQISFLHHDILTLKPVSEALNLIVCKNVMLHFQPDERIEVFRMFHRALAPGGILANENTQKLPVELDGYFEQIVDGAQVYRRLEVRR
ncbi:MAG: MCP methyltransferase, CheR-type [uncultured bacterium]|nr:MAG: MCP methyltransferase, CheR-type [uncultured bacterium]